MVIFQQDASLALSGNHMARKCHLQIGGLQLTSQVSSSGGGLPGCLGLEKVRGIRHLGAFSCERRAVS
jgi:hypothetical protein